MDIQIDVWLVTLVDSDTYIAHYTAVGDIPEEQLADEDIYMIRHYVITAEITDADNPTVTVIWE